ncbi:hypothetical protein SCHPADRAFT_474344 [Schizopora paradoxa]|uniref:UbiA prenyltransferase n=1 Tax=Schizopora paradoxa TaxID=27342 RepID=A0A0H2RPM3_9AGAM|nr:hypothetical protein SCHPADRAFT_474344 [Schizopora paradoxa]
MTAFGFVGTLLGHAKTLFLFTKSDFKTVMFPVSLMAAAAAPTRSPTHFAQAICWIWLHLLQFDVSNQTINPLEDEHNKSYRPLPAKRITLQNAITLRWALVPICWLVSSYFGRSVLCASIALVAFTMFHNELHAHRSMVGKNIATALTLAAFEVGAILITGDNRHSLGRIAQQSLACSIAIFTTTIYSQDFKDVEGDALIGRKTVPIMFPTFAGPILATTIQAWTLFLIHLWQVELFTSILFGSLAVCVALSFTASKTVLGYQRAYYLYNAWVVFVHCLPFPQHAKMSAL